MAKQFTCQLVISIAVLLSFCTCANYNEETLRRDISKLFQGSLEFNTELPSYNNELPSSVPKNHSEWDFVVIGAGSAGSVLASRLSEIEDVSVLLIEAGSDEYPIMDIPLLAPALQLSDQVNWMYESEPSDSYCLGMEGSKCKIPRGKVMGGSSVLNYMVATRGNRNDFDHWANVTGDSSWSYDEMLKYFKKLENFQVKDVEVINKYHGFNGPVYVSGQAFQNPLAEAYIEAGKELNFPNVDYNGEKQIGFSNYQSTIKNRERWSTNRAYLQPARNRRNLVLSSNSHVDKILIDPKTKEAYGVQFTTGGETIQVKARKEIILSAGAINSPQILMLSGVGPAAHLQELGIKVVRDAPVGKNLMDHVAFGGLIFKVNDSETYQEYESNILDSRNPSIRSYLENKTGVLTLNAGIGALAYLNVDDPNPSNENPNIELLLSAGAGIKEHLFGTVCGIRREWMEKMADDEFNHTNWVVFPMLMHPKSRGKLMLRSSDPKDKPMIYANYLSEREDVETLIKAIRFILKLSQTDAMRKFGSELYETPVPCDQHELHSDDYWECAIRFYSLTIYHQSGTCKMGRNNDESAVVDPKLKVIGIKGLRVVDASIMPKIVSAHPNVPIIAIAEKTADSIKKEYQ